MATIGEAGPSSSKQPSRIVSVVKKNAVKSYPPCIYCNDEFKSADVIITNTRDNLISHAGCHLVMRGSESTFQIPDMSALSTQQKASVFKKAKDRLESLEETVPSESLPPVPLPAEKSKECASCLRLSSTEFFYGSSNAVSLSTQLHHFDILLEDEYVLPSFKKLSEVAHKQVLTKIIAAVLLAASGASYGTNWTHRSIALCTAMEALRIEELMTPMLTTTSFEQILKDVDNHLRTLTTQHFLRSLITGVAFEDVRIMARFPTLTSLPDASFIISPRFIHEKYQEMISFGKKLDPEEAITATLWAIVGVVAATGTQALGKAKVPRKPMAKKDTTQTTGEADAGNQKVDGDAATELISKNVKGKQPLTAKRAKKAANTATIDEEEESSEEEYHKKKPTAKKSRSSTSSTTITQSTTASKRTSGRSSTSDAKRRKLDDDHVSDVQVTPLISQSALDGMEGEQGTKRPRRAAAETAKSLITDTYARTAQEWDYIAEGAPLSTAAWVPLAGPSSSGVPPSLVRPRAGPSSARVPPPSPVRPRAGPSTAGVPPSPVRPRAGPSSARVPPSPLQVSNRKGLMGNSPKAPSLRNHGSSEDLY